MVSSGSGPDNGHCPPLTASCKESTASRLIEHGNEAYLDGAFSDAHTFWVAALVKIGEADRSNSMAIVEQRATVLMQMAGAAHKQGEIKQAVDYGQASNPCWA